jgi:hypothetical protein
MTRHGILVLVALTALLVSAHASEAQTCPKSTEQGWFEWEWVGQGDLLTGFRLACGDVPGQSNLANKTIDKTDRAILAKDFATKDGTYHCRLHVLYGAKESAPSVERCFQMETQVPAVRSFEYKDAK